MSNGTPKRRGGARRVRPLAGPGAARLGVLQCLHRMETEGALLDPLLDELGVGLTPRDKRLARHLVLGCLRWQKRLDWIAGHFSGRPPSSLSPWARLALRVGLYQLFWMDRIPAHAAVSSSVELARRLSHEGIARMVNAVLRRAQREGNQVPYPDPREDPVAHLAVYHSHPEWLVQRWLARWGLERTEALLRANNQEAPLYIRRNPLRGTAAELTAALAEEGYPVQAAGPLDDTFLVVEPDGLFQSRAHARGLFTVQDINAGLAVALLAPHPGGRVADLCSAPGGKSAQLAMLMEDRGLVLAGDVQPQRLARVRAHAARLGLHSIRCLVQDARVPAVCPGFAQVLADVPCSATGTLGRHPDARWRREPGQLPHLVARQERILRAAYALLAPNGVLVYSTCSLEEEENVGVVERFLDQTAGAVLEPARHWFPDQAWAGACVETLPGREPGDGSFAARIRRQPL